MPLILCVAAAIACALAPFTPIVTGALFLYFCFVLTLSVIDFRTQLLPDKLTLPLLWLGLVFNAQYGLIDLHDAVYGAVAGYGVLWCVYWGVWLVCHKEGLGYGDFKLLAAAGAWCGWQTLPMILLIASLGGIGYAIVSQLLQRRTITTIAFGPWLALGSMINLGYLAWISYYPGGFSLPTRLNLLRGSVLADNFAGPSSESDQVPFPASRYGLLHHAKFLSSYRG